MALCGFMLICFASCGSIWFYVVLYGLMRSSMWFYAVLSGFTGFYVVLCITVRLYVVLCGPK